MPTLVRKALRRIALRVAAREAPEQSAGKLLELQAAVPAGTAGSALTRAGLLEQALYAAIASGEDDVLRGAIDAARNVLAEADLLRSSDISASLAFAAGYADAVAALRRGDLDACERALVASAAHQTDVHRSFGPPVAVANALIRQGRTVAVAQYLQQWASCWRPRVIRRWVAELNAGGRPVLVSAGDVPVDGL